MVNIILSILLLIIIVVVELPPIAYPGKSLLTISVRHCSRKPLLLTSNPPDIMRDSDSNH